MEDDGTEDARTEPAADYTGVLASPFYLSPAATAGLLGPRLTAEAIAAHQQRVLAELFLFFEVDTRDPDRWRALAIKLARRHVPGMAVSRHKRPRSGPKTKWKGPAGRALIKDMEHLIGALDGNVTKAAEQLLQMDKWKHLNSAKNAAARYYQALREQPREFGPLDKLPLAQPLKCPKKRGKRSPP